MTTIQVAAAQISPQITAVAENRDKIEDALRRAVTKGARLLVCPECALTGYAYDSRVEASPHAETMPGPASDYLGRITRELDAYLIFGLLEKDGTRLYNSAALLGPEGLLAVYRKTHLPVLGVDRFADAGNGPLQVIQTPIGGIGMMICYDAVFPECARVLGLGGADILALPTNYPVGKANRIIEHVLPARTIENRVFLVAANRVGLERGTTFAGLVNAKYPDVEIKHFHHAGNSSGVVDGAAAVLVASKDYAQKHGLKPRARIVATANMGDDPTLMLNAPVPAAKKVLAKAGLTTDDIDLFEINEAFAVVAAKFVKDLGLDWDKVNVNGGSIALGHPIGATGSILIGTMVDELERQNKRYGLVTMCAAGGMAPAIIVERVDDFVD